MEKKTILWALLTLLCLINTGYSSPRPPVPVATPPSQTEGQMVVGIQAAMSLLESQLLLRFVRTPDQQFFDRTMALLGRTFAELPGLAQVDMMGCPGGTMHNMCSWCEMPVPPTLPPCASFVIPGMAGDLRAQTAAEMIAGIQGTVKLLEGEILMRFVHTPNQRFLEALTPILARTSAGLPRLSSGSAGRNCGAGTVAYQGMCIGRSVIEQLQRRRPPAQ